MLGMSAYWMSRVRNAADYLVAGRLLPFWVLAGTITATSIGTGVVIGAPGLAYQHGWAGAAYPIGLGLGTALAGLLFAATRRYRFMTLGEEIACYYGGNRAVTEFSNLSLFLSQLCWLTVQIMGAGSILGAVTGLEPALCMSLAGLVMAGISIPGGLKTVAYTDFINASILLAGFGFLTYSSLVHAGGLAGMRAAVPAAYFSPLGVASYGIWPVAGVILALVLAVIADPGRRLAMYSARSENAARWSMVAAGTIVIVFSATVGIIGMYALQLNRHLPSPDQALPWLVVNVLPHWLAVVVVISMTSAMVSCANANASATGTFFVRHVYPLFRRRTPPRPVATVRRTLVIAYVVCTAVALHAGTIVGFVVEFLSITMSGLAIIILMGHFWKRATWQGALAALAVTPAVAIILLFVPGLAGARSNPTIPAAVAGTVAFIAVSFFTPPGERSFAATAETLKQERQAIEGETLDRPA
jgi:SSS family solute:Na+ symporter